MGYETPWSGRGQYLLGSVESPDRAVHHGNGRKSIRYERLAIGQQGIIGLIDRFGERQP